MDCVQEIVQLDQGHVRVNIFHIGLEQGVLQSELGKRQRALGMEVLDIVRGELAGQRLDKGRKLRVDRQVGLFE